MIIIKEYDKEIILIEKQKQAEGSIADTKNVSQASQASQTLVKSGDASGGYNNDASQASQSKSCNTIYRLGRSDIFACQYCRLRAINGKCNNIHAKAQRNDHMAKPPSGVVGLCQFAN